MLTAVGRHLRGNVVGWLALLVALSGTSYAAVGLHKGEVKGKYLAKNAVTSVKVKNHSLRAQDLRIGVLPTARLLLAHSSSISATEGDTPPPSPDTSLVAKTFVAPSAGVVQVEYFVGELNIVCTTGSTYSGLYVDGKPVKGTAAYFQSPAPVLSIGSTPVTKGEHTVSVGSYCKGGTYSGSSGVSAPLAVSVVMLGS